jgi:hypothetical protein
MSGGGHGVASGCFTSVVLLEAGVEVTAELLAGRWAAALVGRAMAERRPDLGVSELGNVTRGG